MPAPTAVSEPRREPPPPGPKEPVAKRTDQEPAATGTAAPSAAAIAALAKSEDASPPPWVPGDKDWGPWYGGLFVATSSDGLNFGEGRLVLAHAGVPNLLVMKNGDIVAFYQYFSFTKKSEFNVIAYSVSKNKGQTWDGPHVVDIAGIREAVGGAAPVDPTVVETSDGGLRLYLTVHAKGSAKAMVATAKAPSLTGPYTYEGPCIQDDKEQLLDPAVVWFGGQWHYFTPKPSSHGTTNLHYTSKDGVEFTQASDVAPGLTMWGNPVVADDVIRFYGTGSDGVASAWSRDGSSWTMDSGTRSSGFDPGAARLSDGTFLLMYTDAYGDHPAREPGAGAKQGGRENDGKNAQSPQSRPQPAKAPRGGAPKGGKAIRPGRPH